MATEDINKANILEEAQIDETKDVQESEEDSDPGPIFEKWRPMIDAIADATKEAFPASPPFDPSSPLTFQTYWRGVFTSLKDSILKNKEISQYLTEPPVSTCSVTLFDDMDVMGCPCCQSPSEPAIQLKNENGVTKEDFMNAIIDTMYGEELPKVFVEASPMYQSDDETDDADDDVESDNGSEDDEPEAAVFENDSGVLVYTYGWMSAGGDYEWGTVMYGNEPDIILYCCPPGEFEKLKKRVEKKTNKEGGDSKDEKEPEEPKEAIESKL